MRIFLSAALCLASSAVAEPMWEQADRWHCDLNRHLLVAPDRKVQDMNPNGRSYVIDFDMGTVTSAFVDAKAGIVERAWYPSEFGNHNLLVAEWDSGRYPFVVLEEETGFWEISGSGAGSANGEAWIALYQCRPF